MLMRIEVTWFGGWKHTQINVIVLLQTLWSSISCLR